MAAKKSVSVAIPGDLTKSAMARIIQQLMAASDGDEEQEVLDQLEQAHKESNDLADLHEEKRGAVSKIAVDDEEPKKGKRA
jgi:hypothetical protein